FIELERDSGAGGVWGIFSAVRRCSWGGQNLDVGSFAFLVGPAFDKVILLLSAYLFEQAGAFLLERRWLDGLFVLDPEQEKYSLDL
ncbi:MAG: hypothetical protein ACK55I_45105, partial [bacterium]